MSIHDDMQVLGKDIIQRLLQDKTTKKNIIWATDDYPGHDKQDEIDVSCVLEEGLIKSRTLKAVEEQQARTRAKAEVFTPSWVCNKMNNHCDEEWFGRSEVFNIDLGERWTTVENRVLFPEGKSWEDYIESKRIEITCGEAPFVVSRYDTTTGDTIDIKDRIGILDRKLRIVGENAKDRETWLKWAFKAFQSTYGYEFQGDNLIVARINLMMTFWDYYKDIFAEIPEKKDLMKLATVITWNFWQMDGLTDTIPFGNPESDDLQTSFFDMIMSPEEKEKTTPICRIYDWKANRSILFTDVKRS